DRLVDSPGGAVPQQVVLPDAGAVGQEVADAHQGVGVRVGEVEGGQVLPHRVVPPHVALVHQGGDQGGGEALGAGGEREGGVRGDRVRAVVPAAAVPLDEHRPLAADDHHGGPGHVP